MKIVKTEIKKEIIKFLKKKNNKFSFKKSKGNLIQDEIIDSIDFLNLISDLEMKFKVRIDLSNEDPNIFAKINNLNQSIYSNCRKR